MKFFLFTVLLFTAFLPAHSQKSEVFQKDGAALRGYDPVAFFTAQKPVKGSATFSTTWKDATWHFSSPANLNAFIKDPERYAPQYGGYCAYGMAGGYKAPTEIDTWTIVNGKLYFNYNQKVKDTWSRDIPSYIQKADANWPTVKTKS